ncbi:DoxX family protein [Aliifodinibius sp. S!AR15-10]|nr:DoxX family protein [Aliifodinibius sp. S!AR15-10]
MMLFSATMYFTNPQMAQTFEHLGFPDYFRIELGIGKIIGVLLLLAPFTGRFKEWVYAGFTINMISASIAHSAAGDPISAILTPLVLLGVLAVSYVLLQKLNEEIEPEFIEQLVTSS